MMIVSQRLTQLSAAALIMTLSLGLVVPKIAGIGFLAIALMATAWLSWHRAWLNGELNALERLFVFLIAVFVLVWALAWWGHGLSEAGFDALGRILRLLLIIPIFLFFRRADGLDQAWWWGLIFGGLLTGLFAWWFFLTGQQATYESRVEGATNPIYFGGIALAMAVMLLGKLTERGMPWPKQALVSVAIVMAFCASLLSGSRGAWLALAPMLLLYVFTLGKRQASRWRFGLPIAVGMGALLVLFAPQVPTSERLMEGLVEIQLLTQGVMTEGALGRRWQMWLIALNEMQGHWFSGIGPGAFATALQEAIARGEASSLMSPYRHPHSQYLSALTDGGIALLVVWVLLLATAARRFYRLFLSGLHSTRQLGWAGLSAIVLLAVMALSESIFERNAGIVWFGLLSAGSMGLVHVARRRELKHARNLSHQQRLSVIIITKNEGDRIGRCLSALDGWADEIIVLDSGSTDATVSIAQRHTPNVHLTDWPGYGRQKQRAMEMATGDWILSIDADEVVSEDLKAEIDEVLSQSHVGESPSQSHEFDAYTLPWVTHAFGYTLTHGRWSRTPLRLIRRGAGKFSDVPVHERLIMASDCQQGHLEGALHHWPYRDIAHAKAKLSEYARLQVNKKPGSRWMAGLRAAHTFLDNLIWRAGFLDGRGGWILSQLLARYTYQKYRGV